MPQIIKLQNQSEDYTSRLTQIVKASADPLRLEILRALSSNSYGVLELCEIFNVKQSGLSHHLKLLNNAGLVTTRREGNSIFYRRSPLSVEDQFFELQKALYLAANKIELSNETLDKIQEIHAQRAITSQAFFTEHAAKLKEQQELIAAFDVYGQAVEHFIGSIQLNEYNHALEIGPGEGELLPFLSSAFQNVVAIDNNESILSHAISQHSALSNTEWRLADTSFCSTQPNKFNLVVANMVLHHTPSPDQIFKDVSRCLEKHGSFVICELTQHDQDWAREACGDQWLGFKPEDLSEWANEHNLIDGQSEFFALRNGFQIQIRQFIKT